MSYFARSVRLRSFSSVSRAAALALAAMVLSGCEVTETGGNGYNRGSGPVCPMIYEPVCAESRGQQRTFPNACQARAEAWRVVAPGQCRSDNRGDFRRDRDDRRRDFRRDRDDGNRDFRDWRQADNDQPDFERPRFDNRPGRNAPVLPPVRPQPPVYQPPVNQTPFEPIRPPQPGGACGQRVEPVCGQIGTSARMFTNRCELLKAGAIEVADRQCRRGRP